MSKSFMEKLARAQVIKEETEKAGQQSDNIPSDNQTIIVDNQTIEQSDNQTIKQVDSQTTQQPDNQTTEQLAAPTTIRDRAFKARHGVVMVSFRMPEERKKVVKAWCARQGIDFQDFLLSAVYEKASCLIVDNQTNQLVEWSTSKHDDSNDEDLLINDDKPLSIYRRLTGNRVRQSDKDAAAEIATIAPAFIESGIIMSMLRAAAKSPPSRVNSFRYCLGAIEEACQQQKTTIDSYVIYLRKKLREGK
jgi:predicted DNA binding CopG/RHH family protein